MNIPGEYDFSLNNKGYLVHWGMERDDPYTKRGTDLVVERQDFSQEMSENKIDSLFWSSQRSWFGGGGQTRRDNPQQSNPEMFLRARNIDTFAKQGEMTLSHRLETVHEGVAEGDQTEGFIEPGNDRLYWVSPTSADPTEVELKSIQQWSDTPAVRGFDANWPTGGVVEGMATDGEYIYVSNLTAGIWRGKLTETTTDLVRWTTTGVRDIAFVKDRIVGHTAGIGGVAKVIEFAGSTPDENTIKEYPAGWLIRRATGRQNVFATLGAFVCWVATNGPNGYLWLWDGQTDAFQAAKFEGWEAWACFSFGEALLYVLARDPSGEPFHDRWAVIQCDVSASGNVVTNVLHVVDGRPIPDLCAQNHELLLPVQIEEEDTFGLGTDAGQENDGRAFTVASFCVPSAGLNLAKHWGLTAAGTITAPLWGGTGFEEPSIRVFRSALVVAGENGELRAERVEHSPVGEIVSSAIDFNIDSDKVFLIGEAGTEPLPAGTEVTFEFTTQNPNLTDVTWTEIGSEDTDDATLVRGRTGSEGTKAPVAHYRVKLESTGAAPVVRKAGLGAVYALKPKYDHMITVKAFRPMELNNGQPWPASRTPDVIQAELEGLRDNQTVVDFVEPTDGDAPRSAVKVQVRAVQVLKKYLPQAGWTNLLVVLVREVPE